MKPSKKPVTKPARQPARRRAKKQPGHVRFTLELFDSVDEAGRPIKTTVHPEKEQGATWHAGGCTLVNVQVKISSNGIGTFTSFFEGGDGDVWIIYAMWPEPTPNGPKLPAVTDGNGNTKWDSDTNTGLGIPFGFGFVFDPRWFDMMKFVTADTHC